MRKYFLIFTNSLSEYFAYRLNFILWRVRVVISILITYFLWDSVFAGNSEVFGYSQARMLTYVILLTFLTGVVLSTQTHRVASEINLGELSKFLLKPVNYFAFNLARDLSDKFLNTTFSIFEIILLVLILRPPLILQTSLYWLTLFVVAIVLATILFFEISLILSFIGFWSKETWAPRFIFFILITFLAGTYFPLDIFPRPIYQFLQLLPFTYIVFFPLKIYLGELTSSSLQTGLVVVSIWLVLLFFMIKILWQKGLKIYTAEGS